jgi:uncharacterized protein YjiS (DUF1127 family)
MNVSQQRFLASADQQKISGHLDTWLSSTLGRVNRIAAFWAERSTRARELRELHRFSDRELWDVGLSRSDIPGIEHGTYRRD